MGHHEETAISLWILLSTVLLVKGVPVPQVEAPGLTLGIWTPQGCKFQVEDPVQRGRFLWALIEMSEIDDGHICNNPCGCHPLTETKLAGAYYQPMNMQGPHQNQFGGYYGISSMNKVVAHPILGGMNRPKPTPLDVPSTIIAEEKPPLISSKTENKEKLYSVVSKYNNENQSINRNKQNESTSQIIDTNKNNIYPNGNLYSVVASVGEMEAHADSSASLTDESLSIHQNKMSGSETTNNKETIAIENPVIIKDAVVALSNQKQTHSFTDENSSINKNKKSGSSSKVTDTVLTVKKEQGGCTCPNIVDDTMIIGTKVHESSSFNNENLSINKHKKSGSNSKESSLSMGVTMTTGQLSGNTVVSNSNQHEYSSNNENLLINKNTHNSMSKSKEDTYGVMTTGSNSQNTAMDVSVNSDVLETSSSNNKENLSINKNQETESNSKDIGENSSFIGNKQFSSGTGATINDLGAKEGKVPVAAPQRQPIAFNGQNCKKGNHNPPHSLHLIIFDGSK